MPFCNNCGQEYQYGIAQCPNCGVPLVMPQQQFQQPVQPICQTIPVQPKKKKHGCLIAIAVFFGIGLIGTIFGESSERQSERGTETIESSNSASKNSTDKKKPADSEDTEDSQDSIEEKSPVSSFSYEVTDTRFEYYTNSIGDIEYYGIVEILNTGNTNIYLDDCTFDLEDNDGHLLQSDDFISTCPDIIAPGEKGWFYNSLGSTLIDDSVSFANGINLVPNFSLEKATGDIVDYEISDTSMRTGNFDSVKITGRITNNTSEDDSLVYVQFIFYGYDGKVLAITGTNVTGLDAGKTLSFEGDSLFANDSITIGSVSNYEVIARKAYYQF